MTTSGPFLHERIRYTGAQAQSMYVFIPRGLIGPRAKHLLADNLSTLVRSYIFSLAVSMERDVCLGRSPGTFIRARVHFGGPSVYLHDLYSTLGQETQGISTAEMSLAREIHLLQAYQLRCLRFLDDLNTTINFIRGTPHPGMDLNAEERHFNRALMDRECSNLLMETDRFRSELQMQGQILQNILGLVSRSSSFIFFCLTHYFIG